MAMRLTIHVDASAHSQCLYLAIGHLHLLTPIQDLKDFARQSGLDVVYSEVNRERDSTGSGGKGFVEYETAADLAAAVEKLDQHDFKGAPVTCVSDVSPLLMLKIFNLLTLDSRNPRSRVLASLAIALALLATAVVATAMAMARPWTTTTTAVARLVATALVAMTTVVVPRLHATTTTPVTTATAHLLVVEVRRRLTTTLRRVATSMTAMVLPQALPHVAAVPATMLTPT